MSLKKHDKELIVISKFNYLITLKKEAVSNLNLKHGDSIDVFISKLNVAEKPTYFINNGKIDLLFFIPDNTLKGSKIFVEEVNRLNESYLTICSFHERGSASQIEIKRFVDPYLFGKFLGQLQAEGSKTFMDGLEFCNKSLSEHRDFVDFLYYLGIQKNKIFTKLDYHESIKNIKDEINKFENFFSCKINYISKSNKSRGGSGLKIIVRSTLLSEIVNNSLHSLRKLLASQKLNKEINFFANGFLAKLLSGDGSFEIISKNRNVPQARLYIADWNLDYLNDYASIMSKYGFSPKINHKWKYVRSYCNDELAKKLLKMGAFDNNPNKNKLISFIKSREKYNFH
ncbi:hypothetical protein HYT23_02955 [Candidatus Pacearchaeota archaeon]|nr:hypothetical protein [Candidatus Pacearchaeota archaeon]